MALSLSEKDREILFLRERIDSLTQHDQLSAQLFKELKSQQPELKSISVHQSVSVNDTTAFKYWMAVIDMPEELTDSITRQRIDNWLKARLEADSVRVYY